MIVQAGHDSGDNLGVIGFIGAIKFLQFKVQSFEVQRLKFKLGNQSSQFKVRSSKFKVRRVSSFEVPASGIGFRADRSQGSQGLGFWASRV